MSGWRRLGFWVPASIDGAPIALHWTIPVVGALVCRLDPIAWAAYFALLLWHVLGHAVALETAGARCTQWEVTGFGGLCRYRTTVGAHARVAIAWSGVAAQLVLLATALLVGALFDFPRTPSEASLAFVLVQVNLALMVIELLPLAGFDGAEAWDFLRSGAPRVERRPPMRDGEPRGRGLTPEERADNERTFEKILEGMKTPGRTQRRDDDERS